MSGASVMYVSKARMIVGAASIGHSVGPASTSPTSCRENENDTTTPKLPPPPRSAQNRSGSSDSLVRTSRPSASTTSAAIRLSIVSPPPRVRWPRPPPSVMPPTPVVEMIPLGSASPNGCVAWSTSPSSEPPSTRATRETGSTITPRMAERSITRPSSTLPRPPPLWPPPRIASGSFSRRACPIAAITSAASVQRAISAGRRSIIAL